MSAVVAEGTSLLIAHRRLYPTDEPRFFVGRCVAYEAGVVKLTGRTFVRDMSTGQVHPKKDERTKIVSLVSGLYFVYELPENVDLATLRFQSDEGWITAVDASGFEMNLDEHPHT